MTYAAVKVSETRPCLEKVFQSGSKAKCMKSPAVGTILHPPWARPARADRAVRSLPGFFHSPANASTSSTSLQVGNGRRLARLYWSIAFMNRIFFVAVILLACRRIDLATAFTSAVAACSWPLRRSTATGISRLRRSGPRLPRRPSLRRSVMASSEGSVSSLFMVSRSNRAGRIWTRTKSACLSRYSSHSRARRQITAAKTHTFPRLFQVAKLAQVWHSVNSWYRTQFVVFGTLPPFDRRSSRYAASASRHGRSGFKPSAWKASPDNTL